MKYIDKESVFTCRMCDHKKKIKYGDALKENIKCESCGTDMFFTKEEYTTFKALAICLNDIDIKDLEDDID